MAKKMQRLDESNDFRPFKFRIQAFTNAFLEELNKQGYSEDKIPMKKAKSKGNHIWNIHAKKEPESGGWIFRKFQRKISGQPPGTAYIGSTWSYTPHIWDPQQARKNDTVRFTSPNLPPWLSWRGDTLSGIPPPDAQSIDITVEARFVEDGQQTSLSNTFHLLVSPLAPNDVTYVTASSLPPHPVRPALLADHGRRIASDSVVTQTHAIASGFGHARRPAPTVPPPTHTAAATEQFVSVLSSAAERVALEAAQDPMGFSGPQVQANLAKQQAVLTVTANAITEGAFPHASWEDHTPADISAVGREVVTIAAEQVVRAKQSIMDYGIVPTDKAKEIMIHNANNPLMVSEVVPQVHPAEFGRSQSSSAIMGMAYPMDVLLEQTEMPNLPLSSLSSGS
ncbi:hypothetical protein SISSUDRAFT_414675 [Sistotremastrum suecicum HHB10207 ss-3]|uniref:Uncharacterized protein n=1 Tax=Sistotremastrum suecicum HHB10207 ss-3 TaxID=1314776 RepID=A0A166FPD4_9AGAM|nr:hypothetical protein SISSUDRAFT_414675 [Sistotremastrum suecicum HHB10207 ss-3]